MSPLRATYRYRRFVVPAVLALTLVISAVTLPGAGGAGAAPPPDTVEWTAKLDEAARRELSPTVRGLRAPGTINLLVATATGAQADVASAVQSAGGSVLGNGASLDYLRITVPRAAVATVVGDDTVIAADLDHLLPIPEPIPLAADAPHAVRLPDSDTPAVNPYLPVEDIGAVTFAQDHPVNADHRVRVGIVDTGVDIAHPGLQRDGRPVTKLWTTALRPGIDDNPAWVSLPDQVATDEQGSVLLGGGTYRAPHEGSFRVGYLKEAGQTAYGEDLDGDGVAGERLPILVEGDTVWTDPDGDRDFTTDPAATVGGVPGQLRLDDPRTTADESLAFVAESAEVNGVPYVHVGFDQVGHGTHVAGIVAGNELYESQANGVAPGADLYSVQVCHLRGCPSGAMVDAVALLARDHDVDVINMSVGGLFGFNNGRSAAELLYTRIANEYDAVLVFSAGNDGDGVNTVGSPAAADNVLSVGASISAKTWQAAYGVDLGPRVFAFSSRGLREDGALAPQLVAPGAAISTLPVAATPPGPGAGYGLRNGTSMSSPMAAGAAALLLGAARAEGLDPRPAQVRAALVSGARHIDGADVTSEGAGQVDLSRAWQILAKDQSATSITVDAPVCTPYSVELTVPGRGPGLHQRCATRAGGPAAGHHDYVVTLTRTSGSQAITAVKLRWRTGHDQLDVATTTVRLPLRTAVEVAISIDPTAGTHLTGLLEIDDPATAPVDQFLPVSVAVAHQLDDATLTWTGKGEIAPGDSNHYFVEIPPEAALTTASLAGLEGSARVRFVAYMPAGVPATEGETRGCYSDDPPGPSCEPTQRTFEEPFAGIWEVVIQGSSRAPAPSSYTLQLRAEASAALDAQIVLPSTPVGGEQAFSMSFANTAGIVDPTAFAPLVSENRYERRTLRQGESQEFEFTVPENVPYISGRVRSVDGASIDVHATRNGDPLGHLDGVGPGEFLAFTSPGDVIQVIVTVRWIEGESTQIWYEDRLHRHWAERRANVRITGVTTKPATATATVPTWTASKTQVLGVLTVLADPAEGRVLGTTVRLRVGETGTLAQTTVRLAAPTVPLDIDSGLADATGARYTIYEGDPRTGVEVTQAAIEGSRSATIEPTLTPWPAFDPARTYTVIQTADPVGHAARERQQTTQLIDGRLVATFVQDPAVPGRPSPTDPAPGASEGVNPVQPQGSAGTGSGNTGNRNLALTGPAVVVALAACAAIAIAVGAFVRRRKRSGRWS